MDNAGEWMIGLLAPLEQRCRGRGKLVQMVAAGHPVELLDAIENVPYENVPLLLCVAENDRAGQDGRPGR